MEDTEHSLPQRTGAGTRISVILLGVLSVIAVGCVLKLAQSVVLPLIIAWLLSYILGPVVTFLTRRRVPAGLAVTAVLILVLCVCYLLAIFLHARIVAFVTVYPEYEERFMGLMRTVTERFKYGNEALAGVNWTKEFGKFLVNLSGSLVAFLSRLVMVIIFLVFLLLGKPYSRYKLRKALSPERAEQVTHVLARISKEIGQYLSIQLLISLITGVLVWLALRIIGVDFAVTWGALTFFLNFVPTVGSIVAGIPPVLLAWVQFPDSLWPGVATLIALFVIQMGMGNFVAPKVMGDKLNLSPVVVLLSLVFWGWLWGIVGALLSVPLASAVKIVCENIEPLHPISVMMSSGKRYRAEFESG